MVAHERRARRPHAVTLEVLAQRRHPVAHRGREVGDLETDVEEGVPAAEALPGEGRIASGELPGGPVVTTMYTGVPEGLGAAYARIGAWLQEHGEEPAGPAWEVYHFVDLERFEGHASLPDRARWRHPIVQPIK